MGGTASLPGKAKTMFEAQTTGQIVDEPMGKVEQLEQLRWEQGQNLRAIKVRLTWIVWLLAIPYLILGGLFLLGVLLGSGLTLINSLGLKSAGTTEFRAPYRPVSGHFRNQVALDGLEIGAF